MYCTASPQTQIQHYALGIARYPVSQVAVWWGARSSLRQKSQGQLNRLNVGRRMPAESWTVLGPDHVTCADPPPPLHHPQPPSLYFSQQWPSGPVAVMCSRIKVYLERTDFVKNSFLPSLPEWFSLLIGLSWARFPAAGSKHTIPAAMAGHCSNPICNPAALTTLTRLM